MSTNFYWKKWNKHFGEEQNDYCEDGVIMHIGKRSASGLYCFDCGTTLHKYGTGDVHKGQNQTDYWYKACPVCGKYPQKETIETSSVGIELGFNNNKTEIKNGVCSSSSFTWSIKIHEKLLWESAINFPEEKVVVDEYGDEHTAKEFLNIINSCPIHFQIPANFS